MNLEDTMQELGDMPVYDVVIVGAGPNGLLLATELALAGVSTLVLEQLPDCASQPKANGLVGRVVEALDRRGIYTLFSGSDSPPVPLPHSQFGGLDLDLHALPGNALFALMLPQRRMEELLEARARELGVQIRRGHEVTALRQDAESVTVEVREPASDYRLATRFLVGADGAHSLVRKHCGIGFPGITDKSFVSRFGRVAIPGTDQLDLPDGARLGPGTFLRTERGMFIYGTFQPGIYHLSVCEWDQPAPDTGIEMSVEELRSAACRVLGVDIPMNVPPDGHPPALRRFVGVNSRQADRYRDRRVFLLGDAAHVHSGFGGPGLNLGMQDAFNLGWKLAAEVRGWAPPGLLNTYHTERHPSGERVIMHSRAQIALMSPGPNITALREILDELLRDHSTVWRLSNLLSGADIHYDMRAVGQPHPLTGQWMPDLPLDTGDRQVRLAELLRCGRPLLLSLANRSDLIEVASSWTPRVHIVTATTTHPPADAVLIRPDGYVAWAGQPRTPRQTTDLHHALCTWFGPPTHPHFNGFRRARSQPASI